MLCDHAKLDATVGAGCGHSSPSPLRFSEYVLSPNKQAAGSNSEDLEKVRDYAARRPTAAMRQCADNPVQDVIEAFSDIFRKKSKHEVAIFLQQRILAPVAPVRFGTREMLFPIQLNSYTRIRA